VAKVPVVVAVCFPAMACTSAEVHTATLEQKLLQGDKLATDSFSQVAAAIAEQYGTKEDDKLETNQKLDDFIEEFGDVNFYVCSTLLLLDPVQEFETFRSQLKLVLLPLFQITVPFAMIWFFVVQKDMITDNGYCCNHTNIIFRFTGFVTFMYSAWQIIDGSDDVASKFFMKKAAKQWALTGQGLSGSATLMFYLGHASQQICCMLLLVLTYIIYTTQCDTPLDLLMNCVAINFVLDIDTEWMDDGKQAKSKVAATYLFKTWRDECVDNEADCRRTMGKLQGLRSIAPALVWGLHKAFETLIWVSAYCLVFGWTFCPASW